MGTINTLQAVPINSLADTSNSFERSQGEKTVRSEIVVEKKATEVDKEQKELVSIAAELEKILAKQGGDLSVALDQGSGVLVMRVTDNKTGEVIKQLPTAELLEADLSMQKIIGLFVDNQA